MRFSLFKESREKFALEMEICKTNWTPHQLEVLFSQFFLNVSNHEFAKLCCRVKFLLKDT